MKTEVVNGFQVEDGDTILVGDQTYIVKGEPQDDGDFLLFDTVDEEGEKTQIPFGPFDVVTLVVSLYDDEPEDVPID